VTRKVTTAIGVALLLTALVAAMVNAAPARATTVVTATARVEATVEYTVIDAGQVEIHANTGWQITAETADGVVVIVGAHTDGAPVRVRIPNGTEGFSVTAVR
jgi:hypothetical protein